MSVMSKLDPLWGMAGTLILAYTLDRWIQSIRATGFATFEMDAFLWGALGANLVLGLAIFWLAWFTVFHRKTTRAVAFIFFITGLGLTLLPIFLTYAPASFDLLYSQNLRGLRITLLYSAPNSRLFFASAFITAIGLYGLLPRDRGFLRKIMGRFW